MDSIPQPQPRQLANGQTPGEQYQDAAGEWRYLAPHHIAHLAASRVTLDTAQAAGLYTEDDITRLHIMLESKSLTRKHLPALVFPFGEGFYRVRPDVPIKYADGKAAKYLSPRGRGQRVYFPPGVREYANRPQQELLITEGEKKSLAATQEGFPCIGLTGVNSFAVKGKERLLPELEAIVWAGRRVYIAYDSDIDRKPEVAAAESRLARLLTHQGALVKSIRIPGSIDP